MRRVFFYKVINCKNCCVLLLISRDCDNLELYKIGEGGLDWEEKVSGGSIKNKEE